MDDRTAQRKLDQLVKISNELVEEAKERYGNDAQLFFEAGGTFYIMTHDDGAVRNRQDAVVMHSNGYCQLSCGIW